MLVLLSILVGCRPTVWADCEDARCRAEAAEAAFLKDPKGLIRAIARLDDEIGQAALIEQLVYAHPADQGMICAAAKKKSPAAKRCDQLNLRPHLFAERKVQDEDDVRDRSGSGPAQAVPVHVEIPPPWGSKLPGTTALVESCGREAACLQDSARELAIQGNPAAGLAACGAAWPTSSIAHAECVFQVAETLGGKHGSTMAVDALAMCGKAGDLARNCTQHVLTEIVPQSPPADAVDQGSLDQLITTLDAVGEAVGSEYRDDYRGMILAVWTRDAMLAAEAINGDLLAFLPAEAAPHVRAAAAWALVNRTPEAVTTLDDAAVILRDALLVRKESVPLPGAAKAASEFTRVSAKQPPSLWLGDRNAYDRSLPAVFCLGAGRRTLGLNDDDDLRIAVLEAGARASPPLSPQVFVDVLGSAATEQVKWTAARLLAKVYGPVASKVPTRGLSSPVKTALGDVATD